MEINGELGEAVVIMKESHKDSFSQIRKRDKLLFNQETSEILNDNNNIQNVVINSSGSGSGSSGNKAVGHMRECVRSGGGMLIDQSFLSDHELKVILTEASDGFIFIARCYSGQIVFVSESIIKVLNINQTEWFTSNLFDQIHPNDVNRVKEQLIPNILLKRQIQYNDKNNDNLDKRNFSCRMKLKPFNFGRNKIKTNLPKIINHCYAVVQCNGLIRKYTINQNIDEDIDENDQYCFVGTGRIQIATPVINSNDIERATVLQQFATRHTFNGNFIFVDQRIHDILGYTTIELLGKCFFDYFYRDDCRFIKETFKFIPSLKGKSMTVTYRFWSKAGYWVWLRIKVYVSVNVYSNILEDIICECTVLPHEVTDTNNSVQYFNALTNKNVNYKERYNTSTASFLNMDQINNTFTSDLFNNTNDTDWSEISGAISLPPINDWPLQSVVELLPQQQQQQQHQQDNWPIWPLTTNDNTNNDISTLYPNDQLDLWSVNNNDNILWPKQQIDNNWQQQFPITNDIENYENLTQLYNLNSNILTKQFCEYNDPQQQQQQQHSLWSENELPILTQNLQNLQLTIDNKINLNSDKTNWKLQDIYNQYSIDTKTGLICDQNKQGPKLPDLIEQVLHVDQPFRQTTSFDHNIPS